MRLLLITLSLVFFMTACTKKISVKSLQTSQIPNKDIKSVYLEEFLDDSINQKEYLEEELVKKEFNKEKLFFLKKDDENIDAIITGKVLESSILYDIYYKESLDKYNCRIYDKDKKKCLYYEKIVYPCEDRRYKVRTNLKVLDSNENLLFTKNYMETTSKQVCYKNSPYFAFNLNTFRNKNQINSKLAQKIAKKMIKDLAPYYYYKNIKIIDKLEKNTSFYTKQIQNEFTNIIKLIEKDQLELAKQKLIKLDKKLEGQSYETSYNLALIYESQGVLYTAHSLYEDSLKTCNACEKVKLIKEGLNRVNENINNKENLNL